MSIKDFKGKKITVMGLGISGGGAGAASFFCRAGAKVTVTDLKSKKELKESIARLKNYKIQYVLNRHRAEDFKNADLIIRGPAIKKNSPYLKIAKKYQIPIDTDIGVFFELCPCPIIGVTGTKGKSTIATLIHKLLKTKYQNTFLAGNIQKSALGILPRLNKNSLAVLELSSWQLEGLAKHKKSPHIALITNILPDHLNTYASFQKYFEAKKNIYKYQNARDILVLNYDDGALRNLLRKYTRRKEIKSWVKPYSLDNILSKTAAYIKNDIIFYKDKPICRIDQLKIRGRHNLRHILGAITVAREYKVPPGKIRKVIKNFKGIESRLEFIGKKGGVEYFNDTTATNPDAVIAALNTLTNYPERFIPSRVERNRGTIILIAGGVDKTLDTYKDLARHIKRSVKYLVLLPGTATKKIKRAIRAQKITIPTMETNSMKKAVAECRRNAVKDDIVLLSPGAASFNLFKNEFDRGKQFVKLVKSL